MARNFAIKSYNFNVDSVAPTVTSVDPAKNSVNTATNKVVMLTFSETVISGSMSVELKNSKGTIISTTQIIYFLFFIFF
jgi:methionine-rich copper-binding protein CopC